MTQATSTKAVTGRMSKSAKGTRYDAILEDIFLKKFDSKTPEVPFLRGEMVAAADKMGIKLPSNLGDALYAARYRTSLPAKIKATQPAGREWVIVGKGRGKYAFRLVPILRIVPNRELHPYRIPDSTPGIISEHAFMTEQALLAKVRYNRLVDIFLGITTYSLQNHLRTSVKGTGQVEIDEVYLGIDKHGDQFIVPVQAKGGKTDKLSVVQTMQDLSFCEEKFPRLKCRLVSAHFMPGGDIAMFEIEPRNGEFTIRDEKHYRLVPSEPRPTGKSSNRSPLA